MNSDGTGFIVLTISRTRFKQVLRTYCFFLGSYKEIQDLISTLGGDMEMICILLYHVGLRNDSKFKQILYTTGLDDKSDTY